MNMITFRLAPYYILMFIFTLPFSNCALASSEQIKLTVASEEEKINQLMADYWQLVLESSPTFATSVGVRDYDDRLGSLSVSSMNQYVAQIKELKSRLEKIERESLSNQNRINADFLRLKMNHEIEDAKYNGRYMLFTNRWGWHIEFSSLPFSLPFFALRDYESYISRLKDYPRYNGEGIATLRKAIETGYTQPCKAMKGFEVSISTHIPDELSESVFIRPFDKKPDTISSREFDELKSQALTVIAEDVIPAYQKFLDFYTKEYSPKCHKGDGLYGLKDATAYYDFLVKQHTTLDLNAQQVHQIGLDEVARIQKEMEATIKKSGFKGNRQSFVKFLREDPQFYPKTEDEHLRNAAFIAKKADGELPKLFGTLPRMPYTVKAIPADIAEKTTTAYYEPLAGDGTRAGIYRVNTSKLHTRPNFEMEALTLHEAVPGHHLQIALAYEQTQLPAFRRYTGNVTAFIEGWGLYAESLGEEMGFYQDVYAKYGQLSYQMWRACRLVVDTGLHAKGWTREQAIRYMVENTALSLHNIESEVDRYMTWPGQALGYKMGELKIKELRRFAEKTLGKKFDVRKFHDVVLSQGSVPLSVLEDQVRDWVDATQ